MLDLETKYLEVTREVVLKRASDIHLVDTKYCKVMFELGLEQLKVNFETQQEHNFVKHQKVSPVPWKIYCLRIVEQILQPRSPTTPAPHSLSNSRALQSHLHHPSHRSKSSRSEP